MKRTKRKQSADQPLPLRSSQTLLLSAAANIVTWAAFPPLGCFPLAWLAPLGWAKLIQEEKLPGRRPYWVIWAVSALTWGILLEGVGRAFWANYFGLVLLGSYLAVYQVLFVALARVAVHRWKLSVVIAAPAVWTGLELVRGHLITGFSMALLGHTQVKATSLIQIADLCGAYGVSFLVVFVGACAARSMPHGGRSWSRWPIVAAVLAVAGIFVYGRAQIAAVNAADSTARLKVALIQGTEDTILDSDIEAARRRAGETFDQYWRLTLDVCERHDDLDLIVWPEGVFSGGVPLLVLREQVLPPPGFDIDPEQFVKNLEQGSLIFDQKTRAAAVAFNRTKPDDTRIKRQTYLLAGCDAVEFSGDDQQSYNAALLIDPRGEVVGRYDKMHRVMIGEYVPFGSYFPWLYDLFPIGRGLTAGTHPASFDVHGVSVSPSICFEDTVPHLIRRQVRELTERGERPDVLVNLTNDGWFWGSGILDLQLSCAVFRAVELRRPVLVAANTGLTASIDISGTVRDTLPRRREGAVVTDVAIRRRTSFYERWGDLFAGLCLLVCLALALSAGSDRWRVA